MKIQVHWREYPWGTVDVTSKSVLCYNSTLDILNAPTLVLRLSHFSRWYNMCGLLRMETNQSVRREKWNVYGIISNGLISSDNMTRSWKIFFLSSSFVVFLTQLVLTIFRTISSCFLHSRYTSILKTRSENIFVKFFFSSLVGLPRVVFIVLWFPYVILEPEKKFLEAFFFYFSLIRLEELQWFSKKDEWTRAAKV